MSNLRNAIYGGLGFLFPVLIFYFTTPYIVHKLSPEIYGIYLLTTSLMGMLSFLDLGFGQGIIKFVSHYEAKRDYRKVNKIIATVLFLNSLMGLLGALSIFLFSPVLVKIFKISAEQYQISLLSFKIISIGFLVMLLNGVFSNIPKALQRYDVSVKIQISVWSLSTVFTVALLYFGKGLIEILVSYVTFHFLGMILYAYFSKRLLPPLKYTIYFDKETFKEIFRFSILTAINSITGNIVFRVDKMIISYFLGTTAVTYYQVPFLIVQAANGLISSAIQFLFPKVSQINSYGDRDALKRVYHKATKYTIAFTLLTTSLLIILGKPFISLWMGLDFAKRSADILPIIALGFFFVSVSNVGYYFYNGLGKAKINMISSFVGSMSYLIAAIFLVRKYALLGAALSFLFILVPVPVYLFKLNSVVGASQRWYFKMLTQVSLLITLCILISIALVPLQQTVIAFIITAITVTIISLIMVYGLKLIDMGEIGWIKAIILK